MKSCFKNFKLCFLLLITFFSFELRAYCQNEPDTSGERFVKIGNHKLFAKIKGSQNAKFTIIFESGGGANSRDWANVIPLLSSEVQIVTYDRAGMGKSEKGPLPQTLAQNVFELHELLKAAKIKGPLILVGHSMGGLIVRLYTEQYGKDVAGLVLVDPARENGNYGSMRYGGWVRLREKATGKPVPKPQVKKSISPGYDSTADYLAEEFQNMYLSSMKNPQELGERPVIIIGAGVREAPPGTPDDLWKRLRDELDKQVQGFTILSANSKFILDPKSTHSIQKDNPEIVATSIQTVINSITSKTKF